jgi:putative ATP-dependent endonuclease of the OLD family
MYLSQIIILNYKCCQNASITFDKHLPNVLIGINDSGKSTILKAIGLLLDEKQLFNYRSEDQIKTDISNTRLQESDFKQIFQENGIPNLPYDLKQCCILGKFILEDNDIDSDNEGIYSNQLLWLIEKIEDNSIWLARVFDEEAQSSESFILIKDNGEENLELWKLSKTNLRSVMKKYNVTDADVTNVNNAGPFKNIEQIRAIYQKVQLTPTWSEYKLDKELFPKYKYLDWNLSLSDVTELAEEVMESTVEKHLLRARTFASKLAKRAQNDVDMELELLLTSFIDELPSITKIKTNVSFEVSNTLTDLMVNKSNCDGDIHLESQGEGIKRQIWFAFIKWNALKNINLEIDNKKLIWCFDEPETHLYPKAQRTFFDLIKKISSRNIQTMISTHSTVFTDRSNFTNIYNIYLNENYTVYSKCSNTDDVFNSLMIRNSDFLFYDKFLVVEGDTEFILIPHLYYLLNGKSITEDGIQIIKLNGKGKRIEMKFILESIIKDFRKPDENIVYLLDSDAQFDMKFKESEKVYFVGKQDLEDSIDNDIWIKIVNDLNIEGLTLNTDEIQAIKDNIPDDAKIDRGLKFYLQLQKLLREKYSYVSGIPINYNILPDKGTDLGDLLKINISNINQVSPSIKAAYESLN